MHEQIKPHFLYNTLDTIQWMAKSYHAKDIVDIVLALSNFFRVSLSQGKEYNYIGAGNCNGKKLS